ncbi:pimeloyl-ACP methyl ester carboxylesterase [Actinocrispum wychmicini]|uniref:Pimeloyl-ACP methyl ester carboxylesterase n=1 Tax=Actinocrispum wychmicini TaxID=1213861 RepID=A0A4V2S8W2_9PSEU|nr:pimeloyl-ACP methyl ester carboxylesterase [Actinocrispum wychmicini]
MTLRQVVGGNGVRLAVRVAGPQDAPAIVLVHGWAQSSAAWSAQLTDPSLTSRYRLAAVDLRGHGASDVPDIAGGYDDPRAWADDIQAVIDLVGRPAVLVGWSYGGAVIADYLRIHGDADLAGIVFVGASTEIGRDRPGARIGPAMRAAMPDALAEDAEVAASAFIGFARAMSATRLSGAVEQRVVGDSLRVPRQVRKALLRRDVDNAEVLSAITVPTLVAHGRLDAVIDPLAATYAHGKIPGAELRWFDEVGHMPFAERTEEFDEMLLGFAHREAET